MEQNRNDIPREGLAEALITLRRRLKEREKQKTGRTPVICSDQSIREMVRLMPRKASDFYSIPDIGTLF